MATIARLATVVVLGIHCTQRMYVWGHCSLGAADHGNGTNRRILHHGGVHNHGIRNNCHHRAAHHQHNSAAHNNYGPASGGYRWVRCGQRG